MEFSRCARCARCAKNGSQTGKAAANLSVIAYIPAARQCCAIATRKHGFLVNVFDILWYNK